MSMQVIHGIVHDAKGRPLWIQGLDGSGWPMTVHEFLLADFAGLQAVLDEHGHRVATQAAEANLGMDIWGTGLRARLAARQADAHALPAEAPCRWIAEQLAELLDRSLLLDDVFPRRGRLWPDQVERVRDRVEGRMEVLYDVIEFLLDRSETTAQAQREL